MYVGATLPDLVDVRGLVVGAVVTTFALVTVMSVFVLELALLDALGCRRAERSARWPCWPRSAATALPARPA